MKTVPAASSAARDFVHRFVRDAIGALVSNTLMVDAGHAGRLSELRLRPADEGARGSDLRGFDDRPNDHPAAAAEIATAGARGMRMLSPSALRASAASPPLVA